MPYQAIECVLHFAGLKFNNIDVALYWNPYKLANRFRWISGMVLNNPRQFLRKH